MIVTVGRIIRIWSDNVYENSYMFMIQFGPDSYLTDNIISDDAETMRNNINKFVYIYDIENVPNNIIPVAARRTGRLVAYNDGTIMIAQNNHGSIGERVEIAI
jgi:hypothetical protein